MIKPEVTVNEKDRVNALKDYSILDTLPEKEYDDITFLASQICETPISLVSLIDNKRQWFKSNHGLEARSTSKEVAFCAHAINDQENIMVVHDSRVDDRFKDNPLVVNDPNVIFYAGIPLVNPDGFALGTLCVIDNKPRCLNDGQLKALRALSDQVLKLFELRKNSMDLENTVKELEAKNKGLDEFVRVAAHDIKSPLASISMMSDMIVSTYGGSMEPRGRELMVRISQSSTKLASLLDGILKYSFDTRLITASRNDVNILMACNEAFQLLEGERNVEFKTNIPSDLDLYINSTALQQILVNLFANAIKYNDKKNPQLNVTVTDENESLRFVISDNGPGIQPNDQKKIFYLFSTTSNIDKDGFHGTGIGLATVKSLVESLGGKITVTSEVGVGSTFNFTINK